MRRFQYEVSGLPNGKRIRKAGPDIQRYIAFELAAYAVEGMPRPRGPEGLAAVRAGQFGDTPLRRSLLAESQAAEERYGQLCEANDEAEQRGELVPDDRRAEQRDAHKTYRLYRLLVATLSDDPAEAALEAAIGLHGLFPIHDAEDKIEAVLAAAGVPMPTSPTW